MSTEKCPDCGMTLKETFEDGTAYVFTKHDTEFCRKGVLMLYRAAQEAAVRNIEDYTRAMMSLDGYRAPRSRALAENTRFRALIARMVPYLGHLPACDLPGLENVHECTCGLAAIRAEAEGK